MNELELCTFTFGGVASSVYNIYAHMDDVRRILPPQKLYATEIPGLDGIIDFGIGGYTNKSLPLHVYYNGEASDITVNQNNIAKWLYSNEGEYKELRFTAFPNKYYIAKVISGVDFGFNSGNDLGTIEFYLNPPFPFKDDASGMVYCDDAVTLCDSAESIVPAGLEDFWKKASEAGTSYIDITLDSVKEAYLHIYLSGLFYQYTTITASIDGSTYDLFDMFTDPYGYDGIYINGETGKAYWASSGDEVYCSYNRGIKFKEGSTIRINLRSHGLSNLYWGIMQKEVAYAL
jgi:predicted phage tail component-like protein